MIKRDVLVVDSGCTILFLYALDSEFIGREDVHYRGSDGRFAVRWGKGVGKGQDVQIDDVPNGRGWLGNLYT